MWPIVDNYHLVLRFTKHFGVKWVWLCVARLVIFLKFKLVHVHKFLEAEYSNTQGEAYITG